MVVMVDGSIAQLDGGDLGALPDCPPVLAGLLHNAAAQQHEAASVIVVDGTRETRLSYPQLLRRAQTISGGLHACGLRRDDRVVLQLSDPRALIDVFWGCVASGVVPVPVSMAVVENRHDADPATHPLQRLATDLGRIPVITDAQYAAAWTDLPQASILGRAIAYESLLSEPPIGDLVSVPPDATAIFLMTSGTTGRAKCVPLTHAGLMAAVRATAHLPWFAGSVSLSWTGLEHVTGLLSHLREVQLARTQVWASARQFAARPLSWLDWIERYRVALTRAPNFAFAAVVRALERNTIHRWDLSSVRTFISGGETISPRICARFLELLEPHCSKGAAVVSGYGLTETCNGIVYGRAPCVPPDGAHVFDRRSIAVGAVVRRVDADAEDALMCADAGVPCAGVRVRVVDARDQLLATETVGHVQIDGPVVMSRRTVDASEITADGWLRTGDLGLVTRGSLVLVGRDKDLLIVRGRNLLIADIEQVVRGLAGVDPTSVAVCRYRPQDADSDSACIFVASGPLAHSTSIEALVRQAVAQRFGFAPAGVFVWKQDQFPRSASGKILRIQLTERLDRGELKPERPPGPAPQPVATPEELLGQREHQIHELFRRCFGRDDIGIHDDFFSLGGDSLAAARLTASLSELLGDEVSANIVFRAPTAAQIARALASPGSDREASAIGTDAGLPVCFVPEISGQPWVFQRMAPELRLTRSVCSLRAPDLDWQRDVLTIEELVTHYLAELRRLHSTGPYSLIGYSFGGTLAFEMANRLVRDGLVVDHVVMIDTWAPMPLRPRLRTFADIGVLEILRHLCQAGVLGYPMLRRIKLRSPFGPLTSVLARMLLCLSTGPLSDTELRTILRVAWPDPGTRDLGAMSFAELCDAIARQLQDGLPAAQWEDLVRLAGSDRPIRLIKAQKVFKKNFVLAARHRLRSRYPGKVTIYACDASRPLIEGWRRYLIQPPDIRRVAVTKQPGQPQHRAIIERHNIALFAGDLRRLLLTRIDNVPSRAK
ncbi:MAG: alpha/beta fold hydrolase [Cyanobacteria bacterium]|nr:alpha/beta fold hydrolase [Cyanobacteriota bacterium]